MTKVKICGLQRPEDIEVVNELKPDFIGFVFAKSKRSVTADQAKKLKQLLIPEIKAVGVFVDAPQEEILALIQANTLDVIQLHGHENASYIQALKAKTSATLIKAVRVRSSEDIEAASFLPVDYLLLDAYHPKEMGGSGVTFDWRLIPPQIKPYFLAGGLSVDHVATAIKNYNPYGLDVSSKVETEGYKDHKKVAAFIEAVRKENQHDKW